MTTVRIAHAEPRPGLLDNGEFQTLGHLVVLADDAGRRAVPVWLRGEPGEEDLAELLQRATGPAAQIAAGVPQELTEQAGLRLEVLRHWWRTGRPREDHGLTIAGGHRSWSEQEITAWIPDDADIIRFGIVLTGAGRIALRNPELRTAEPARGA